MTAKLYASLGFFTGINNVEDSVRLRTTPVSTSEGAKSAYPLTEAMNMDIDNDYAISSRAGLTERMTGTSMHSYWANFKGTECFFVDGNVLYQLGVGAGGTSAYVKDEIATLANDNRVSFTEVNSRVYYTNNFNIGYIENGVSNDLTAQSLNYKLPLPAGKFIGYYKGRIYVAKQNVLYISDVMADCYDVRYGYRVFHSDITMVLPVDDGIYISASRTWFLKEDQVLENDNIGLSRTLVDTASAIPYTGIQVPGDAIASGVTGIAAMWVSNVGICVGDNEGQFTNITEKKYVLTNNVEGSSVLRDSNGIKHFLSVLRR